MPVPFISDNGSGLHHHIHDIHDHSVTKSCQFCLLCLKSSPSPSQLSLPFYKCYQLCTKCYSFSHLASCPPPQVLYPLNRSPNFRTCLPVQVGFLLKHSNEFLRGKPKLLNLALEASHVLILLIAGLISCYSLALYQNRSAELPNSCFFFFF